MIAEIVKYNVPTINGWLAVQRFGTQMRFSDSMAQYITFATYPPPIAISQYCVYECNKRDPDHFPKVAFSDRCVKHVVV